MNPWGFIGTYREQVSYNICEKHAHIHENQQRNVQHLNYSTAHRVCAWLCTKDYMPGRQNSYKRMVAGGPRQPRLMGRTFEDVRYSRNYSVEGHLRSPDGQRQ